MDLPRVVFSLPKGNDLGGVTTWTLGTARRLRARSREVTVLSHGALGSECGESWVERVPGPSGWEAGPRDVSGFVSAYRRTLPGVVVPNWSPGTYAACARLVREGAPLRVVGIAHSDEPVYYGYLTYYAPMIAKFLVVSREIREALTRALPERAADVVELPYPIDCPSEVVRRRGEGEPVRLAYAGRLDRWQKRTELLIPLAERLVAAGVDFRLRIVGAGRGEPAVRRALAAASEAVRGRVRLEPRMEHARVGPEVWGWADVCVLLSAYEGCSIAMREAMGWGCVPAVTQVSGVAEWVEPGRTGLTAPVDDPLALSGDLAALLKAPERLRAMGEAARARMVAAPKIDVWQRRFEELVAEAWAAGAPSFPRLRPSLQLRPGSRLRQLGRWERPAHVAVHGLKRLGFPGLGFLGLGSAR